MPITPSFCHRSAAASLLLVCFSATYAIDLRTPRMLKKEENSTENALSTDIAQGLLLDVGEEMNDKTIPLFWHIPKAGGTTVSDVVSHCLGLVTASEVGGNSEKSNEIGIMQVEDGSLFVNVDTTTVEGLKRAQDLGFAESEIAEVVTSGFVPQATHALFDETHTASLFSLFRHPSERTISLFYYLRDAHWESTYHPEWKSMSLKEYLKSPFVEADWMMRHLLGKYREELTDDDLDNAKTIISKKVWVGLITKMEESMNRFGAIYNWNSKPEWKVCTRSFAKHGSNKHRHPEIDRKSEVWTMLQQSNYYDLQLYAHAVQVFQQQREHFINIKDEA